MKPRHSFSSRHTRRIDNIRKQRQKYPAIAEKILQDSDIILEVLDARFIEETRNKEFEDKIKEKGKKIVYVLNKSDLIKTKKKREIKNELYPHAFVSCTERRGIRNLRSLIKRESKKIERTDGEKIVVGIIGYPNTGKSTLINTLIGKASAGTGSEAGFTKNLQKLKLDENTVLLDSPGVIPEKEYSGIDKEKMAKHTKVSGRSHSQVKDPDIAVHYLMKDHSEEINKFYEIDAEDSDELIQELGKKKGYLKKGGEVNEDKTARLILKDWQQGKIKV